MKQPKEPTCVSLVFDVLQARSDFTDTASLVRMTGCPRNNVLRALLHLRGHKAVDVVVELDGTGWWFATPESDTRYRRIDVRIIETNGRKQNPRKKKGGAA